MLFWYVLLLVACFSNFDLRSGGKVTKRSNPTLAGDRKDNNATKDSKALVSRSEKTLKESPTNLHESPRILTKND